MLRSPREMRSGARTTEAQTPCIGAAEVETLMLKPRRAQIEGLVESRCPF